VTVTVCPAPSSLWKVTVHCLSGTSQTTAIFASCSPYAESCILKFLTQLLAVLIFLITASACSYVPGAPVPSHRDTSEERGTRDSFPDPRLTPGDALAVTREDVCTPGYTKKVRNVPAKVKNRVYQSYGRSRQPGVCCEVDHLIPLELGGSNRDTNLWPELYDIEWNAKVKDRIEDRLHKLVCAGELDLATAQQAIARNWIAAYRQYEAKSAARGERRRHRE
jgi:hypothetical protein